MNAHRMDQETVERLLDDRGDDAQDSAHPLVPLLLAVRARALPGELDGEQAAVQAFRRTLAEPVAAPRRRLTLTRIGARAGLAALALAATGGVALAATGALPTGTPGRPVGPPSPSAPSASASSSADTTPGSGNDGGPSAGPGTTEAPAAALSSLCRTFRDQEDNTPGRSLESPAFDRLVVAAGGPGRVPDYCDQVLAEEERGADRTKDPDHPGVGTPPTAAPGRHREPGTPDATTPPGETAHPDGTAQPGGSVRTGGTAQPDTAQSGGTTRSGNTAQLDGTTEPGGQRARGGTGGEAH